MRLENAVATDVLERILSAYGFTMQKELSDKLGIAKSNVASWLQRGQVPGNVLVQCALDTGADIQWLVTGKFANANIDSHPCSRKSTFESGEKLIAKMLSSGGRAVLDRVIEAYGFTTQKELSNYLNISTATISTWIRREYFPADVVIACALDTGQSLHWLALGETRDLESIISRDTWVSEIERYTLIDGELKKNGKVVIDKRIFDFPKGNIAFIESINKSMIVDLSIKDCVNGDWVLKIDGAVDVYSVTKIPGDQIIVSAKRQEFTCSLSDVVYIGLLRKIIQNV
jgi:transcriptional regulator with XRE-family HTH domain